MSMISRDGTQTERGQPDHQSTTFEEKQVAGVSGRLTDASKKANNSRMKKKEAWSVFVWLGW